MGALVGIMISFDEALDSISAIARPLGNETVAVNAATGRVLAAPVIAQIPSPRCDVSAMDGYAVRDGDLAVLPARLRVIGESFAGGAWKAIGSGECIRIFTGAPVPDGAALDGPGTPMRSRKLGSMRSKSNPIDAFTKAPSSDASSFSRS